MSVLKKPDLTDPKLRAKLAKGMGHNYYGEPAWPNDLLYIFPVVILGTLACVIGLSVSISFSYGRESGPVRNSSRDFTRVVLLPNFQPAESYS